MRNLFTALALLVFAAPGFAQDMPPSPIAKAQLLVHAPSVKKNQPITAGVLFTLPEHWHIYWQNPGDSGLATALEWTLPEGITASDIQWPAPERIDTSGIINYGYSDKVILPVTLTPDADSISGDLTVKASWLVCKDICIPESATLTATLPTSSPQASMVLDAAQEQLPVALATKATYGKNSSDDRVRIALPAEAVGELDASAIVHWYPVEDGVISNAGEQSYESSHAIIAPRGASELPAEWHGILTVQTDPDSPVKSYAITATLDVDHGFTDAAEATAPVSTTTETLPFILTLLFAFLGGLILNAMPCVLPILSLKALALAKKSGAEQRAARAQGLAYTLGVIASFMAIAGVMLALKAAGASIGWGFQLQEPSVIAGLALLMLLVALNLLGTFELPVLFGSAQTDTHSLRGAFLTGALAVALATPCTAPFMAPAIGATLLLGTAATLLVFAALGLGMAAPFLLISLWPAARRILPKPGIWMLRFKQFLAFPMFATGAWLLWVLVQINGIGGLQILLLSTVLVAWLLWWAHVTPHRLRKTILLLLAALVIFWGITRQPAPQAMSASTRGEAYSPELLRDLRQQERPVFVDATAAWCLTCKINERVALENSDTKKLFAEKNIALLVADWTTRDATITDYLAGFGRNGVPLYVYYPPNGEPIVLPQLLTPASVQEVINR